MLLKAAFVMSVEVSNNWVVWLSYPDLRREHDEWGWYNDPWK